MGIWLHTHTITTTDVSPDLWELGEILPDASVQTMPLGFDWGYRTFQTVSNVHVIHIYELFECLLRLCMGIWLHIPSQMILQIWECWLKSYLMQVYKHCHYTLVEAVEPSKLHPMSMSYIYELFECLLRLWMGIWLHTDTISTILWINLLKRKNCGREALHSYLELS